MYLNYFSNYIYIMLSCNKKYKFYQIPYPPRWHEHEMMTLMRMGTPAREYLLPLTAIEDAPLLVFVCGY